MNITSKPQSERLKPNLEKKIRKRIRWIPSMLRLYENSLSELKSTSISKRNSFSGSPHSVIDFRFNDHKSIPSNKNQQLKRSSLMISNPWRLSGLEDLTLACFQLTDRMEIEKMMLHIIEKAKAHDRELQHLLKNDIFGKTCNIENIIHGIQEKAMKNTMDEKYKKALIHYEEILNICAKKYGAERNCEHPLVSSTIYNIACISMRSGNYDPSLFQESALLRRDSNDSHRIAGNNDSKHFNIAPKIYEGHTKVRSELDPNIALVLLEMGIAHFARHELKKAIDVFREAYRIGSNPDLFTCNLTGNDKDSSSKYDSNLFRSKVLNNIGCVSFALKQYDVALTSFDDSLVILRQLFVKAGFHSIAFDHCHQRRPDSSALEWRNEASKESTQQSRSISIAPHLTNTTIEDILLRSADILLNQAYVYIHIHKEKDAHDVLIEALLIQTKLLGENHEITAFTASKLSLLLT